MMYSTDTSQTGDVMDIYIVIIVILAVIALVAILAPVTVKYGEGTEAANEEEIVAKDARDTRIRSGIPTGTVGCRK